MARLIVLLLLVGAAAAQESAPLVIGHRGARAAVSENMIAAFEYAIEEGADVVELDMVLTADDRVLVTHDLVIDPEHCLIPGGISIARAPRIRELTFEQTQEFDCGTWTNPDYPEQKPAPAARMPSLEQVLERFAQADVDFMIETKVDAEAGVDPDLFAERVNEILERFDLSEKVILQSFDHRTLAAMKRLNPRVRLCLLNPPERLDDYVAPARELGAAYQFINYRVIEPRDVTTLHDAGIKVFSGTVDDPDVWRRLIAIDVDGILTDDPAGLIALLKTMHSE